MKVQIVMDDFPLLLLDMMTKDIMKHDVNASIEVKDGTTVQVEFSSDDIVKVQLVSIICDKYRLGSGEDGSSILLRDEDA